MNFLNLVQGAAGKVKGVATLLSGLTKTQAIIAGVATVTAVGGVGTGGYFLYDHFHQPEPIVADVVISTEVAEEPTEEVVAVEEVVTEETEAAEPERAFSCMYFYREGSEDQDSGRVLEKCKGTAF